MPDSPKKTCRAVDHFGDILHRNRKSLIYGISKERHNAYFITTHYSFSHIGSKFHITQLETAFVVNIIINFVNFVIFNNKLTN